MFSRNETTGRPPERHRKPVARFYARNAIWHTSGQKMALRGAGCVFSTCAGVVMRCQEGLQAGKMLICLINYIIYYITYCFY